MGYCTNCGNQVNGERFCPKCGAALNTENKEKKVQQKMIKGKGIIIFSFLILIIIIGLIFVFKGGRSCEDVAKAVVDAEFGCTSEKVVEKYAKVLPEKYFNYIVEEGKDWLWDDANGWIEYQYEENYSDNMEKYKNKFGDDYKYSFKIVNEVEYDDERLESYAEDCEQYDIVPKEAKDVTIKVRATGNDTGMDYTIEVTMIKIGRSWYLLDI